MKKRILIVLFVIMAVSMAACKPKGSNPEPTQPPVETQKAAEPTLAVTETPSESKPEVTEVPAVSEIPEVTDIPEITDSPEVSGTPQDVDQVKALKIKIAHEYEYGEWDSEDFCYYEYEGYSLIKLSDDEALLYPQMQAIFEEKNKSAVLGAKNSLEWLRERRISDEGVNPFPTTVSWYDDYEFHIHRADSNCVSYLEYGETYSGGLHGMYGVMGYNYDTKTGQVIEVSDVVSDSHAIAELMYKKLIANSDNIGAWISISPEEIETMLVGHYINWTLDYDGVTFYWNPYEIASYADGIQSAKVLFTEAPEVFTGAYMQAPVSYMIPIEWYGYYSDLDDDGTAEKLKINVNDLDEWGDFQSVTFEAGGKQYIDEELFGYSNEFYYVVTEEGKYIYAFAVQTSEDDVMTVYRLDGMDIVKTPFISDYALAGEIEESEPDAQEWFYLYYDVLYTPQYMAITDRNDVMGTLFGTANYCVGENGAPKCLDQFYTLYRYDMVLLIDMEFDTVDFATGEITGRQLFPAGTVAQHFRTDGISRVDFETADGVCFAVYDIDGMVGEYQEYEVFDGIGYAD